MRFIRKYTEEERFRIIEEVLKCVSNSLVSARYAINTVQLFYWKSCHQKYSKTLSQKNRND